MITNRFDLRPIRAALALPLLLLALGACRSSDGATAALHDGTFLIGVGAIPGSPGYDNVVCGVELAAARLNGAAPRSADRSAPSSSRNN